MTSLEQNNPTPGHTLLDYSIDELRQLSATIADVERLAETLPVVKPAVHEAINSAVEQRAQTLARAAGALALTNTGTQEHAAAETDFITAMQDLGLSRMLVTPNSVERLRLERLRRGYSQEEVANMLGVSVSYVSRIEGGQRGGPKVQAKLDTFFQNGGFDAEPRQ